MTTIQTLINVAAATYGSKLNSTHVIGTFSMRCQPEREATVNFTIMFRPDHIQTLLESGVYIDLDNCKMADLSEKALRFKKGREAIKQGRYAPYYYMGDPSKQQTGVIENWLIADARCTLKALASIAKFARLSLPNVYAVDNNHRIGVDGWKFKTKYPSHIDIESQYSNIKAIRRTCHKKPANSLLPIQKRVSKLK